MSLVEYDKEIIWHPFTQEKTADPVIAVKKASGSYIYDENDKAYLDLVSSWWVNIHGHANEFIAQSIYSQSLQLEHVIFAGFTHEPAVKICRMLKELLPDRLTKFFFSDNGSTATEVALKMCYQHFVNEGCNKRTKFLSFDGAYHGDTFGAMSVSISSGFHNKFEKLCFPVFTIPFPETWLDDDQVETKESNSLSILKNYLQENADSTVAFIIEPLIQGASGMRMCRPQFITEVVNMVRGYNIRIIFDEVFVGFGRTGTLFAFQQMELSAIPDVICFSKGLTGGFLPLALTVTTDEMYDSFLNGDSGNDKTFYHGHSYTANPIGCAAAIASLQLLTKSETLQSIEQINQVHNTNLPVLQNRYSNLIHRARITGTVAAFNFKDIELVKPFKLKCLDNGLLMRPLGTAFYLLPPYCTTMDQLHNAYHVIEDILQSLHSAC